ncbi:hypothetical protein Sango_2464600 [Sesamum angolense]|uniref:Uncharacterized protein n=1 Tax=Sesamum angolense TaxID=2727404 RepID=A0AAE2BKB9_9LAMI|nr:hypothetical protein Sango_2464600 [Sesamum angolense]
MILVETVLIWKTIDLQFHWDSYSNGFRKTNRVRLGSAGLTRSGGMAPTNITASINTIPMLNGSNFKSWKENLEIVIGVMDLDLALREDSVSALTDKSTSEQKRQKERWEKSNRYFSQFKVSYNCQRETWSLNELISHCVQEEERLKQDKTECAYFASTSKERIRARKEKRIMELQIQPHRRNNKRNQMIQRLYVTSVRLKGTLKSIAPTFMHDVLRKVCLSCQKPNDVERYIYVGDGKAVLVEAI